VGLVLSGLAVAKMDDGTEGLMKSGDFVYSRQATTAGVVGDGPYARIHVPHTPSHPL
jgi:hypothetical protein